MIAKGTLRVLSASEPDPYPDSIHIDMEETDDEDGGGNCSISKAGRQRKKKSALQQAIARLCK